MVLAVPRPAYPPYRYVSFVMELCRARLEATGPWVATKAARLADAAGAVLDSRDAALLPPETVDVPPVNFCSKLRFQSSEAAVELAGAGVTAPGLPPTRRCAAKLQPAQHIHTQQHRCSHTKQQKGARNAAKETANAATATTGSINAPVCSNSQQTAPNDSRFPIARLHVRRTDAHLSPLAALNDSS